MPIGVYIYLIYNYTYSWSNKSDPTAALYLNLQT